MANYNSDEYTQEFNCISINTFDLGVLPQGPAVGAM